MEQELDKAILKETHRNSKRAVRAIETILPKIYDNELAYDLNSQLGRYREFEQRAKKKLNDMGERPEPDKVLTKAKLWSSIQINTLMNTSTKHIADMMVLGNTRGISEMLKVIGRKQNMGTYSAELANELMDFEVENIKRLKSYL